MWKKTGYLISVDSLSEDKSQKATYRTTEVVNQKISKTQFNKILEIIKKGSKE